MAERRGLEDVLHYFISEEEQERARRSALRLAPAANATPRVARIRWVLCADPSRLMRVALAVVWDSADNAYHTFREGQIKELIAKLAEADLVVGFNVIRFDYQVLRGYTDMDFAELPTFDLLDAVHARLGFRVSLGHLGEETLGEPKSADGLQSLKWWKEGRIDEIGEYCLRDVRATGELYGRVEKTLLPLFRGGPS